MKKNKIKKFLNDYMKWKPPKIVVFISLFIPFLFLFLMDFKLDNDFWFLINTGKYIINNGIPHIEPFTIHSNLSFVAQQWLTDIIFYLIYNKFNIYGMYIFILISNIIVVFLLYKISMLISNNQRKLSMITSAIVDIMLIMSFLTTRPQVFDIILLLSELYLLELYIKRNNKKYLIGLPIISLLMINLHASVWPMVFVFLLPYYVGRINLKFTTKENYKLKPIIIVTIIMFVFGFINPYGIEAMKYLFNSYGIDYINELIGEMRPLTIENGMMSYIYILFIIITYLIKGSKINSRYTLLLLGTILLSLQHVKGELFFLVSSIIIVNYNLKDIFSEENKNSSTEINKKIKILLLTILCIITLISFNNKKYIKEAENYYYEISEILKENKAESSVIYTGYDAGAYIEYQGFKCYIDPRAEVFLKSNNKKENIFIEYYEFQNGKINIKDFINKYKFDYIIIDNYESILHTYIDELDEYTQIYNKNNELKLYKRIEE